MNYKILSEAAQESFRDDWEYSEIERQAFVAGVIWAINRQKEEQ